MSKELEVIRAALAEAVARTSLRETARAVGVSPTGLDNVLEGNEPRPATVKKLTRWYKVRTATAPELLVRDAVEALVALVAERERERVRKGIAGVLSGVPLGKMPDPVPADPAARQKRPRPAQMRCSRCDELIPTPEWGKHLSRHRAEEGAAWP